MRFPFFLLLVAGCGPKAASLELVAPVPELLLTGRPMPLPTVRVKDAAGTVLTEHPPITFRSEPNDVMKIENGQLVALGNGQAQLTAHLADPPLEVETWVKVRSVKRVQIDCVPACSVPVGGTLSAQAIAIGDTERFPLSCALEVSGRAFEVIEPGKLRAIAVGVETLRCGDGEVQIRVNPTVDRLRIDCPTARVDNEACVVGGGASVKIPVIASGKSVPVTAPALAWTSSRPGVATVSGGVLVPGVPGTTDLTATVDGVSAKLSVTVTPPTSIACDGQTARFMYTWLDQSHRGRGSRAQGFTVACESEKSEACIEANLAIEKAPELEQFQQILTGCCCEIGQARIGPSKVQTPHSASVRRR